GGRTRLHDGRVSEPEIALGPRACRIEEIRDRDRVEARIGEMRVALPERPFDGLDQSMVVVGRIVARTREIDPAEERQDHESGDALRRRGSLPGDAVAVAYRNRLHFERPVLREVRGPQHAAARVEVTYDRRSRRIVEVSGSEARDGVERI